MAPPRLSLGGAFSQYLALLLAHHPELLGYVRSDFPPDFIDFATNLWENPPQWRSSCRSGR